MYEYINIYTLIGDSLHRLDKRLDIVVSSILDFDFALRMITDQMNDIIGKHVLLKMEDGIRIRLRIKDIQTTTVYWLFSTLIISMMAFFEFSSFSPIIEPLVSKTIVNSVGSLGALLVSINPETSSY